MGPMIPRTVLGYAHATLFFRTTDGRCRFVDEKAAFQLSRLITAELMSYVMCNFCADNFFYLHWTTTHYESRLYLVVVLSLRCFLLLLLLANRKISKAVATVY